MADTITFQLLVDAIGKKLRTDGFSHDASRVLALNHAGCDGALSHGVFRVPQYAATLRSGLLDPCASPRVDRVGRAYFRVDAAGGVTQSALEQVRSAVNEAVAAEGLAVIAIANGHHHSALWPDIEPFAREGFAALTMVTGGQLSVAPAGVRQPVFGTNPLAFALPVVGALPLVADLATSSMSYGDLTLVSRRGGTVAYGVGVDATGVATNDARAIVDGAHCFPSEGTKAQRCH